MQFGQTTGYWTLYGTLPWIDYHNMFNAAGSTEEAVLIDTEVFEQVLNGLWGLWDRHPIATHFSSS